MGFNSAFKGLNYGFRCIDLYEGANRSEALKEDSLHHILIKSFGKYEKYG
jgi:hypothetical protein